MQEKRIDGKKLFNTVKDSSNVAEYVIARLVDLGITHSFCVPGDFAFPIDRALVNNELLTNIINANELNASYAADGYARVKGAAILSTTYAVGELSALNGVMGAKAENIPIFHIVGTPNSITIAKRRQIHHTLGDGNFDSFFQASASAACVSAVITPDNARREMNRVISEAFKYRKPAYICVAFDDGKSTVTDNTPDLIDCSHIKSDKIQLDNSIKLIKKAIESSKEIIAIPSIKLDRFNATEKAIKLIESLNIPFVIMPHDKTVISEEHPNYVGFYAGKLSDETTADIVENADLILNLGDALWSDFNTSSFTNNLDLKKVINLAPNFVETSDTYFNNVFLNELLDQIQNIDFEKKDYEPSYSKPNLKIYASGSEKLTLNSFYSQVADFLKKDDNLVVETGSSSLNITRFNFPSGVKYYNQTLWGSIGWATPAILGVALAQPQNRAILITGEGSHQLTLNELGVMGRYNINPIIFCINNNGFTVERALELDPDPSYDDIFQPNYTELPKAFGCKRWLCIKVNTNDELAIAIQKANEHNYGVYIEVIADKYDYGDALSFFNSHLKEMYGIN